MLSVGTQNAMRELLEVTYERAEVERLSYQQKIHMLYGYHLVAQFQQVEHLQSTIADWRRVTKASQQLAVPVTNMEKLALQYFKGRLQVGSPTRPART